MTAPAPDSPPADDSRFVSIVWAVAVIVVALVVGLIAWLALGDRDGAGTAGPPAGPGTTASAPTTEDEPTAEEGTTEGQGTTDGEGTDAPAEGTADAAEQTAPPEVRQLMLDLQRRDPADPMAVGEVDAPVVMIEYADYRCPYCAKFAADTRPQLQELVDDGTLRIEFRDLVLFEDVSRQAAVAARAAAEQDRMEAYQEVLFARSVDGQAELDRDDLLALAEEAGVPDLEAFEESLDDPALAALVDEDTAEARALGITSTPTFLVNTTVVAGAAELDHFLDVVEQERVTAEAAATTTG
ncbi:thioredoxin domain-containing protein [Ornithinimicrobium sp. LYQ103]|uniref:thioredoxin domain-containing protein n=1 Tax=Ornithinimicrobium sp. LYQ103 TaxID=3378796 RepID=UPI0038549F62